MERPRHVAFLAMLLLGVLAGTAGASYPSSSDSGDAAAPAPQPGATSLPSSPPRSGGGSRRSPAERRTRPCDPDRLAARVCDGCPADAVAPTAPCCGPLLAAGRGGTYNGMECFCAMMGTQAFLTTDTLSATAAVDMYYRCGGRHSVAFCL